MVFTFSKTFTSSRLCGLISFTYSPRTMCRQQRYSIGSFRCLFSGGLLFFLEKNKKIASLNISIRNAFLSNCSPRSDSELQSDVWRPVKTLSRVDCLGWRVCSFRWLHFQCACKRRSLKGKFVALCQHLRFKFSWISLGLRGLIAD